MEKLKTLRIGSDRKPVAVQAAGGPKLARLVLAAVVAVALLGTSCSGDSGDESTPSTNADSNTSEPERAEVTTGIADDMIVPGYESLTESTAQLSADVVKLCESPDDANLEAARESWRSANSDWMYASVFDFGPVRSLHSGAQIAYPVDTDKVDALVAPDAPDPLDEAAVADLGADARGLNALQYLLFTPTGAADVTERQCTYMTSAAALVAAGAVELLAAWTDGVDGEPPVAEQFSDPGDDSAWASPTEGLEDVLNSMLENLAAVDDQISAATGQTETTMGAAAIDTGPARSLLADMTAQLSAIAALYGDSEAEPPTGLSRLVAATASQDSTTDQTIRESLDDAIASMGEVTVPLSSLDPAADSPEREALIRALEDIMAVRSAVSTEVASLLGLTVTFTDSDGDG